MLVGYLYLFFDKGLNMQVIIYKQDNNIPAIVVPTQEALQHHTILEIAIKDVPVGKAFKIVDATELPQDVPQEAWVIEDVDLIDGVGGESNEFN
jgi:hypothetical protein